ncbi:hypothetical protein BD309DRAFT_849160 [Dichomitus squalens]|uniref:Uncharacterized protein n=1 Tax=Dichomitus squalens TaxID=114155 RepID=A0A4Q9Q2H5_9APHY|nr:uncharacterized protein DICSQDRAFT_103540 [Dichomitus squalens LYAD-421 SS1]EJF63048.1 hypothetical protein DICSQDRAFT_103540 [Dichomitus squalens LYAD-421 SS1]TBU32205.1 hypothetical protein BD311DRAFT_751506 [Dichomitus squalens]TBU50495.1 hypothetical protein BD309DRAFT_849160 [Dichomitus squalens]TBU61319.1 hypothetical protein BD310DRAFT_957101 [Dichomitus squalens]
MDSDMSTYDAIVFPADDRPPHVVPLMTTAVSLPTVYAEPYRCGRAPHPEVYMDYIADQLGSHAWQYHLVEALDGMIKKFPTPYILFYPVISRDGMPFPVNKCIREIQGQRYDEARAWRGNLVVAKYRDTAYSAMIDASMADFPIIKNYLSTHLSPS